MRPVPLFGFILAILGFMGFFYLIPYSTPWWLSAVLAGTGIAGTVIGLDPQG